MVWRRIAQDTASTRHRIPNRAEGPFGHSETRPKVLKHWGRSPRLTALVPTNSSRAPWNRLAVPRVTIRVCSRKKATNTAFTAPMQAPSRAATRNATAMWSQPRCMIRLTVRYWAQMAMEVEETSNPPEISTIRMPTANTALPELVLSRESRLPGLTNTGFFRVTAMENRITSRKI